jgi:hypothetical protein
MKGKMKTLKERGWRRLRAGEIIRKGDKIWGTTGQWIDCDPSTKIKLDVDDGIEVIRPIEKRG